MKNVNFFLIIFVLLAVAVFCNLPQKFSRDEIKVSDFPMAIGDWRGEDIVISERDYEILETHNLIMRNYVNSITGEKVNLYIVYSADNRKALHPPEVCYTGVGATITKKSIVTIDNSFVANVFSIEHKNFKQLVVYWFKSTTLNTYSYLKQQIKIVTDRLFGKPTSAAMIRVSAEVKNNDQNQALKLIKSFCSQIEPLLAKFVP